MYTVGATKSSTGDEIRQWPNAGREVVPADADSERGAPPRWVAIRNGLEPVDQPTDGPRATRSGGKRSVDSTRELASLGSHAKE